MGFVKTNYPLPSVTVADGTTLGRIAHGRMRGYAQTSFPLPTVTRPDGSVATLGDYQQYDANPGGDQYRWPAQLIALWQQYLAQVAAAKKANQPAPPPPATLYGTPKVAASSPNLKPVQTSAPLGLSGLGARPNRGIVAPGRFPQPPSLRPIPRPGPMPRPGPRIPGRVPIVPLRGLGADLASRLTQMAQAAQDNAPGPASPLSGMPSWLPWGILAGGGALLLVKKFTGPRYGRPIPGAHVYERL